MTFREVDQKRGVIGDRRRREAGRALPFVIATQQNTPSLKEKGDGSLPQESPPTRPMAKNVVVCCDGTANEFARDRTNVIKLFYTLIHDPSRQVAFYHPGLGTMEAAGALTTFSRRLTKLAGLAIGYG